MIKIDEHSDLRAVFFKYIPPPATPGLYNGLAPNRQQVIIWTNADSIHWHIYASLGGDEFNYYNFH